MPKWTDKQLEVIRERDKNLLVSAAAGSGKTTVMVERILNIICSGESSLDRLLVVTFTNAAAASMRAKIAEELDTRLAAQPENKILRTQQGLLDRAAISTIDSFCSQLLKKYYFATPLSPQFTILDEAKLEMLRADAVDRVLEEACTLSEEGNWPEFEKFSQHFSRGRSDNALNDVLLKVYQFAQASPAPEQFYEKALSYYDCAHPVHSIWAENELSEIAFALKGALSILEELQALAQTSSACDQYALVLNPRLAAIEAALSAAQPAQILQALNGAFPNNKANKAEPALHETIKTGCKQIKQIFDSLKPSLECMTSDKLAEDFAILSADLAILFELTRRFGECFEQLKLENGGLDYSDLEHQAILLLQKEEIRKEVQEQYDFIFVDEYQDSNGVQEYLTQAVSRGNNLFFVGDVKQSIYRFRLADPGLFIDKMRTYTGVLGKRIDLNNNFRSAKGILDGVNFIFENIMQESIAEIEYDQAAALYPAPEGWQHWAQSRECTCAACACAYPCEGKQSQPNNELMLLTFSEDKPTAEELAKAEARAIARRIRELEGSPLYDAKLKTCRPAQYKDMVILARSAKKFAQTAVAIFAEEGVPLFCEPAGKLEKSMEVALVMDLLQVLNLRRSDHALLAVMHSCIGDFSPEELAQIRTFTPEGSYYDALKVYQGEATLMQKIRAFLDKLNLWSFLSEAVSLEEFLWRLYKDSGYYYYVAALPNGEKRLLNLELLAQSAEKYAANEGNGLRGFLKYYQNILTLSAESSEAFSLGEADNVVRLMTIHKSKGLEFPIVLIAACGNALQLTDRQSDKAQLLCHKNLGVAAMLNIPDEYGVFERRDPLPRQAILHQNKRDALAEEMRLLYVAMTRTVNHLILCGSQTKKDLSSWFATPSLYTFSCAKSYFDLIMPLLVRHKDGRELWNLTGAAPQTCFYKSDWRIRMLPFAQQEQMPSAQILSHTAQPDVQDYVQLFHERFAWQYPFSAATSQRSKQSVSSLKEQRSLTLNRPAFITRDSRLTAAERGSLLHLFMQKVALRQVASPPELSAQLAHLQEIGFFTAEEVQILPLQKITRFFDSSIGLRLLASPEVYRERPFCLMLPNPESSESTLVQGVIDCYFKEGNKLILLDYKTDYVHNNIEEVIARHQPQLALYAQALRAIYGVREVEMYLYLFSEETAVPLAEKEVSV